MFAPINWRFRSGERFEVNANPTGERLIVPFQVASGVVVPPGAYRWMRYRLEAGTAQKRRLYGQFTWWFGDFYDGTLDQFLWNSTWNPTALLTVEFTGERHLGRLAAGDFTLDTRGHASASESLPRPVDLQLHAVRHRQRVRLARIHGSAGRFCPVADLFVVYNHNVRSLLDRWQLDSNQLADQAAIRVADVIVGRGGGRCHFTCRVR